MAAEIGNKFALKLNTPELRAEAYKQYCAHIAAGYEKKSWYFVHPTITCSWATMEKTIRDYSEEFDLEAKDVAHCKGLRHWEEILYASAKGLNRNCNPLSIKFAFQAKYRWGIIGAIQDSEDTDVLDIQHNQQSILKQLESMQSAGKVITIEAEPVTLEVEENTAL